MTAERRARSAWLLVGSTPRCLANVHSAGHAFQKTVRHPSTVAVARTFRVGEDGGSNPPAPIIRLR
jgi:hypothetical protein